MSHHVSGMSGMECASQGFGQVIGWVDDSGHMLHSDVSVIFPPLNCEESHVCVSGRPSRFVGVDDFHR